MQQNLIPPPHVAAKPAWSAHAHRDASTGLCSPHTSCSSDPHAHPPGAGMAPCPFPPAAPPGARCHFSLVGRSWAKPQEKGLQPGFLGCSEPSTPRGAAWLPHPMHKLSQLLPTQATLPGRDKYPQGLPQLQRKLSWLCQAI